MINNTPAELPTLKNTLLRPAVLIKATIICLGLTVFFLITTIYLALNQKKTTSCPEVKCPTIAATTRPTEAPLTSISDLQKCFNECTEKDFLTEVLKQLKPVTAVQGIFSFYDLKTNSCYGETYQAIFPDKEVRTSFIPLNCDPQTNYQQEKSKFLIGDSAYYFDPVYKRWEQGSIAPKISLRFTDILIATEKQQTLTSRFEQVGIDNYRIIGGTSEIVNEYNQPIKQTYTVYINSQLQLTSFEILITNQSQEKGSFFAYNVSNEIKAPK
ncbi:MAG: hypothetical protein WCJ58_01230 [bacterium]